MNERRMVQIAVVSGAEGPSLQIWGKNGGRRLAGPKAWGNTFNEPQHLFRVDAQEMIDAVNKFAEITRAASRDEK